MEANFEVQEKLWEQHAKLSEDLWRGLTAMGLEHFVENPDDRLCTVNTIKVSICLQDNNT